MSFKQKLGKMTGIEPKKLPSSYQIIGDVLLLKLLKIKSPAQKKKIALSLIKMLSNVRTVCEIREVSGDFREPRVKKLAGKETLTVHRENDILYMIDAAQVMFSKGNLTERKRLVGQVKENDLIVDMFAGIGYFSLGLAKHTKAREIMAIEKNPASYAFLTDNIRLNKLNNIRAVHGDCVALSAGLENKADRIIMGYFPDTEKFLPAAIYMARDGCVIHYHNVYRTQELWKKPLEEITDACKGRVKFEILEKKKVKSYASNTWHAVVDFKVIK